jgi:hypothetical protein
VQNSPTRSMAMRSCAMVSRWRTVTHWSSSDSTSTVMPRGFPDRRSVVVTRGEEFAQIGGERLTFLDQLGAIAKERKDGGLDGREVGV